MKTYCLSLLPLAGLLLPASADVHCWAPHMGSPSPMTSTSFTSGAGKPYRYVIKGYQGWIALGSTDSSATPDANGVFHTTKGKVQTTATSTSQVTLSVKVGKTSKSIPFAPLKISGDTSGTSTGLVVENLATPITFDNPTGEPMTFTFTRTGTNTSSFGVFYVVGEYIPDDPLKGTLTIPHEYLIRGTSAQEGGSATQQAISTPLTYSIDREPIVISPPLPPLDPPTGGTPVTPTTSSGGHDNGNGNNDDGVDLTNPAVINKGTFDPNGPVDDEAARFALKLPR